jgi:DDE superfamily endonuclease
LLYLDECDLHLHPTLGKMWMFKGQQAEIPAAGTNQKIHLFGALNFATNHVCYQISESKTQWQMETFLLALLTECYPDEYLVLVLDSVSYHQTELIENLLQDYDTRIFVLWLPKYCPELSLIERFWEYMKQVVFNNYYFGEVANLVQAAHLFFEEHNTNPEADFSIAFRLSKNLSGNEL